jgi:catechol 2,3-dioxygenase-like lactoylglutathione lyase family enzyme
MKQVRPCLPFALKNIDHLVFRVSSLERSIAFYENVVGCQVVKKREDLGLVHLRAGRSMIDLVSLSGRLGSLGGAGPGSEGRNVDHLCLRIEPFDAESLIAHLHENGVEPLGPVSDNFGAEGDGPSLYFKDPDGNVIEFKGPATGAAGAQVRPSREASS